MKEITELSNKGVQFLMQEEGMVKRPYLDQAGIPTIGVGMTYYPDSGLKVKMTDRALTTSEAIMYFRSMIRNYELGVYSVTRDDINHNQFDALTSFTYNNGAPRFKGSTLLKRLNANLKDPRITEAFEEYRNATIKGVKKPVLLARRKREAALYFTPDAEQQATDEQLYINHIKHIQTKLGIEPDGIFGKNTKAAVIAFQKLYKLDPDGIAGPATLAELNKA
jgi:lysozyme